MTGPRAEWRWNGTGYFLGWLTIVFLLLGTMFKVWGDFQVVMRRLDDNDNDRVEILRRLDRLEQLVLDRAVRR